MSEGFLLDPSDQRIPPRMRLNSDIIECVDRVYDSFVQLDSADPEDPVIVGERGAAWFDKNYSPITLGTTDSISIEFVDKYATAASILALQVQLFADGSPHIFESDARILEHNNKNFDFYKEYYIMTATEMPPLIIHEGLLDLIVFEPITGSLRSGNQRLDWIAGLNKAKERGLGRDLTDEECSQISALLPQLQPNLEAFREHIQKIRDDL